MRIRLASSMWSQVIGGESSELRIGLLGVVYLLLRRTEWSNARRPSDQNITLRESSGAKGGDYTTRYRHSDPMLTCTSVHACARLRPSRRCDHSRRRRSVRCNKWCLRNPVRNPAEIQPGSLSLGPSAASGTSAKFAQLRFFGRLRIGWPVGTRLCGIGASTLR